MAHAAIAYAKTKRRRRAHAVTSSIGPGATNMVTAAAVAHVNRLPVLFIPGDVFANPRQGERSARPEGERRPGSAASACREGGHFRPEPRPWRNRSSRAFQSGFSREVPAAHLRPHRGVWPKHALTPTCAPTTCWCRPRAASAQ
jgi:hypothetical protein